MWLLSDDYRNYTLDISAIRVENKALCLEPFKSQGGIFVQLSPMEFKEGKTSWKWARKALKGRRVQKIGATTDLTFGVIKKYHSRLRTGSNDRTFVNVIEVECPNDGNGVNKFTEPGDSGAVVTDVLDGSCPNPCAIGVHFGKLEKGNYASSLSSPLQHALLALSADLSRKYTQEVTLELYARDTDLPAPTPMQCDQADGNGSPPKRLCVREEM